ncbi:MAG TPA: hypothetical protein VFP61_11520 [Acidimicrobiales bacterium]|nr:hypothetical protein [Acidimicrobiales bacterium]
MAFFDDPLEPHVIEHLRRSVTMLAPGQAATIDRERVLVLIGELQRLQLEHRAVAAQLRAIAEGLGA